MRAVYGPWSANRRRRSRTEIAQLERQILDDVLEQDRPALLRDYQATAVDQLREAMRRGHRRVCFQLPTGAGKTIVFAAIATSANARARRTLILVHRRELIRQTLEKLHLFGLEAGVVAAGWPADPEQPIQVASVATLARRLDAQPPPADGWSPTRPTTPWRPRGGPCWSITPVPTTSA